MKTFIDVLVQLCIQVYVLECLYMYTSSHLQTCAYVAAHEYTYTDMCVNTLVWLCLRMCMQKEACLFVSMLLHQLHRYDSACLWTCESMCVHLHLWVTVCHPWALCHVNVCLCLRVNGCYMCGVIEYSGCTRSLLWAFLCVKWRYLCMCLYDGV